MSTRFTDMAQQAFSFLETSGFRLTQTDLARLLYETAQAYVAIEWDARSGELNVFFGLQPKKGEPKSSFSLSDVLAMENVNAQERKMPFQVAEEDKLAPFLDRVAEDTRIHARPALAGDRMFFRRLDAFRSAQADRYMRDMKLRRVRTEAETAWQKRDLDKLIQLYTSIEDQLSVSEKAKLDYAKEHQAAQ